MLNSSWDKKLPDHTAIIVLLIFAVAMAWFTVVTGERIIENSKNSHTFDASTKIMKEAPEVETEGQRVNNQNNVNTKINK